MKIRFKDQAYQTKAVWAIAKVFKDQPKMDKVQYQRDLGDKIKRGQVQQIGMDEFYEVDDIGYENAKIVLEDSELLSNINAVQKENGLNIEPKLVDYLGRCSLDIEMETGTGKTYVYIKSMFELNQTYGWSKFIVVVPSIAIREGVKKSFEMTEEHFMSKYGKKARVFVYDSSESGLKKIDTQFSSGNDISVMIINTQAFSARGEQARRINMKLDDFNSRVPMNVIARNRPIIILDEPQKMGGEVTKASLKKFNPLFSMSFSATHRKERNNTVYVLDAYDALKEKLVKMVEVKGFEVVNLTGANSYLHLSKIGWDKSGKPIATIEFEQQQKTGIKKVSKNFKRDNDIFAESELEQYKNGYSITRIDAQNKCVEFANGLKLHTGQAVGDVSEKDKRRIQIRETIKSHFEKEADLYSKGIKVLSLFFIDEVVKYRDYAQQDEMGEYARIFEEEYNVLLQEQLDSLANEQAYKEYLQKWQVKDLHKGYFSIDKNKRMVDSVKGKREDESKDISAYDLIMKAKERLLEFSEPTRFIWSHSALREGWDNPNVFQICALKNSDSTASRRQEIGRGLRICVNMLGDRIDKSHPKYKFFDINKLTVIATEGYKTFAEELQKEWAKSLHNRPTKASVEYFKGKIVKDTSGNQVVIDSNMATEIIVYLRSSGYTDSKGAITQVYRDASENKDFVDLPEELQEYTADIQRFIASIIDPSLLKPSDANDTKAPENNLTEKFYSKEFKALWAELNKKYAYTVDFESNDYMDKKGNKQEGLITKAIRKIDQDLIVSEPRYVLGTIKQKGNALAFNDATTAQHKLNFGKSTVQYDLIGKIAEGTTLTRKTVHKILTGLQKQTIALFAVNPEEFISSVVGFVNDEKADMVVKHISYNQIDRTYQDSIFTAGSTRADLKKIVSQASLESDEWKCITDYLVADGTADESVEKKFAKELNGASEVAVYAKLPREFKIPTPVGNYTPDWAIAFYDNKGIKHIYFIAETKGTMNSLQLKPIEQAKLDCAKALFNKTSTSKVRYHNVTDYKTLLDVMERMV